MRYIGLITDSLMTKYLWSHLCVRTINKLIFQWEDWVRLKQVFREKLRDLQNGSRLEQSIPSFHSSGFSKMLYTWQFKVLLLGKFTFSFLTSFIPQLIESSKGGRDKTCGINLEVNPEIPKTNKK